MISGERIYDAFYTVEQNNSFYEEQKVDARLHWEDKDSVNSAKEFDIRTESGFSN